MAGPGLDLVKDRESSEPTAVICRVRLSRDTHHGELLSLGLLHFEASACHATGGPCLSAVREFVA
ncbi:MAG: hypothetical protein R6W93_10135 [Candidatus Limnocylindrales bacterium]